MAAALSCMSLAGCAGNTAAGSSSASSAAVQASSSSSALASSSSSQAAEDIKVVVNVKGEYEGVSIDESSVSDLPEGSTVLDALQATDLVISIEDSSYGPYVTSIGGLENAGSSGWTYSVNGEMVMESAGDCILKNGDVVDWTYYMA